MTNRNPQGSAVAPMLVRLVLALGLLWHAVGDLLVRVEPVPRDRPAALVLGLVHSPGGGAATAGTSDALASGRILATNTGAQPTSANVRAAPRGTPPPSERMTRLHQRTLAVHRAAQPDEAANTPGSRFDSEQADSVRTASVQATAVHAASVLPASMGSGRWPAIIAWLSIVLQLIASAGLLVGLLTRFAAGVVLLGMVGHLWITAIGPAVLLGAPLLPAGGLFTAQAAAVVLLPLGAIALSLALLAAGSGAAGIDYIMTGETEEYDTDE